MTMKRSSHSGEVPTLVPLFGGPDKKPRLLDKDVVAVGRARGCDITLDANEVSAIHCIFYRGVAGCRVRDCGSRTGTRLNGTAVKNSPLADGDVLQIGPFSFELKLPALFKAGAALDPQQLERACRSRRNLARLALQMRHKLKPAACGENGLGDNAADLKTKIRSYDERSSQLKQSEQDFANDRAELEKDQEAHRQHVQQVETDLARRLQHADQDIKEQWSAFQKRCAAEEARLHGLANAAATSDASQLQDRVRGLDEREQRLKEREEACAQKERETPADSEEMERLLRERNAAAFQAEADLKQRQAAAEQAEVALREQKAELTRMLGDLKQIQEELRKHPRVDHKALQHENQQLKQTLTVVQAEYDELHQLFQQHLLKSETPGDSELRTENQQLRQILTEYEQRLSADQEAAPRSGNDHHLREENELLRRLLQEKDRFVEELRSAGGTPASGTPPEAQAQTEAQAQELQLLRDQVAKLEKQVQEEQSKQAPADDAPSPPLDDVDLDSLEAELRRERRQLEADRVKLNREIESLRTRNTELNEATREMEMELSRERAEMARERMRLDRMREDIKSEMERIQRDGGVRESLANVNRLRDEMKTGGRR